MADGILGQIVAAKKAELGQRFAGVSIDMLRARARPTRLSLAAVIAKPGARFILEIKKASPSEGVIRRGADVAALARAYAPVADALSVLTDSAFFGGAIDDVRGARTAFAGPILAKDFFVDPRQVAEARLAGADAILVMLSVLDDDQARAMIAEARQLGMDALVEVHDEAGMRRALALGAGLIGINNRDLRDLAIDLSTTERLAPLARGGLLLSESGIRSKGDVDRLAGHVDGFLVGSALMRADDPGQAARALVHGRVKLCGLNRPEDLEAGAAAAFAGFVFVPGTPRFVAVAQAEALAARARTLGMKPVGVFRNAPPRAVAEAAGRLKLAAVQLHGAEDEPYVATLRRALGGTAEIWKAVSAGRAPLDACGADRILFDHGDGGSGRAFDWRLVAGHPALGQSLVAGGIGASNAAAAAALGAFAIDVGSSVDARPGLKSPWKIRAFVRGVAAGSGRGVGQMRLDGRFGRFGGCFAPEILVPALEQLEAAFLESTDDPAFGAELGRLLSDYAGRPTPLTRCRNLPGNIYLKREDLLHGGAHKTNQVLAQGLLAKRMGKTRLIAETGAGQHGVATAMVGALMGFETIIYMGARDVERQQLNVFRMRLMGATVVPVENGSAGLKDAINEALRDWAASFETTHYLLGTAAGPHPFPLMVREFQRVIGREARAQMLEQVGRLPDAAIACVGGGSNAIGLFSDFFDDPVRLIGVEAAGKGLDGAEHGATLLRGCPGILHGAETYVLQDEDGQIAESWSVSAGLDYPAVGPEHAHFKDSGRAEYVGATDAEALAAFRLLAEKEGILCAFESAHALAHALKLAEAEPGSILLVGLSGRGDKDVAQAQALLA